MSLSRLVFILIAFETVTEYHALPPSADINITKSTLEKNPSLISKWKEIKIIFRQTKYHWKTLNESVSSILGKMLPSYNDTVQQIDNNFNFITNDECYEKYSAKMSKNDYRLIFKLSHQPVWNLFKYVDDTLLSIESRLSAFEEFIILAGNCDNRVHNCSMYVHYPAELELNRLDMEINDLEEKKIVVWEKVRTVTENNIINARNIRQFLYMQKVNVLCCQMGDALPVRNLCDRLKSFENGTLLHTK
ncbi:uncharacterized protein LOC106665036 [Cimex lectularius]|uniref:Uncharacterized protein n=1 Tax=Cimex lectularius TaxID=79782 RepID=A0A8I6RNI5_CIMLE|nr:uncharacterized protein LOC106665036 [Cimex lectularius]